MTGFLIYLIKEISMCWRMFYFFSEAAECLLENNQVEFHLWIFYFIFMTLKILDITEGYYFQLWKVNIHRLAHSKWD